MKTLSPRVATMLALGLLGALVAAGLYRVLLLTGTPIPLDPNEGWNAYHTAAAMAGRPLYPDAAATLVNNYPPLSFYIVGAVSLFTGDAIVAGRLVALTAFGAVLLLLFALARQMGASRASAAVAPLLFAAAVLVSTDYVGMDDPQMLAEAVSLTGLWLFLHFADRRWSVAAAALLFVTAFFIKHNVVALPVAVTLWLIWQDRRKGLVLAAWGAGLGLLGLLLFRLVYGVSLLHVVETARTYSAAALGEGLLSWLRVMGAPLFALALLFYRDGKDRFVRLVAVFAGIALPIGFYFLGGAGVDPNVLFDADLALALAVSLLLQRMSDFKAPLAIAACALPLILIAANSEDWTAASFSFSAAKAQSQQSKADIAFLAAQKKPVLCQMLSLCYWAGKPAGVDMFNVGQSIATGARSDRELVRQVADKRFAVIQLDPDADQPLGPKVAAAMDAAYRLHHNDDQGFFYIPR